MTLLTGTMSPEAGRIIDLFIDRFSNALSTGSPIPISAFFDAFAVGTDEDTKQALINRGDLLVSNGTISNSGDELTGDFHDDNFADMRILFPATFSARASSNGTEVVVDCRGNPISVEFNSAQPIPINPLQLFFQVHAIKGSEVRYFFRDAEDNSIILELKLLYSTNAPSPVFNFILEGYNRLSPTLPNNKRGQRNQSRLTKFLALAAGECACSQTCELEEPVGPSPGQPDEPADPDDN